jgi:hypothetical protein
VTACFVPFEAACHLLVVTVPRDWKRRTAHPDAPDFARALGDYVFSLRGGTVVPHSRRTGQYRSEQSGRGALGLGEGDVWCCMAGEPEPAALLSCDIRRDRPPEQRAELAKALIAACVETLGLRSERISSDSPRGPRTEGLDGGASRIRTLGTD